MLALLVGLVVVWLMNKPQAPMHTLADLARVGVAFYQVLIAIQVSIVLFLAPAAAAGSICIDKARGALSHVLTTDLSNFEIIMGKLGSRLLPVILLTLCMLPVTMLATFLGGIDPQVLWSALLATLGIGVLGCTLSLFISVWARKPHEVLMMVYMIWAVWLLGPTVYLLVASPGSVFTAGAPTWADYTNIFWLVYSPYNHPREVSAVHFVSFFGASLAISALLAGIAVLKVRWAAAMEPSRPAVKSRTGFLARLRKIWRRLPSPSLDRNPVLWREWRYKKGTLWGTAVVLTYILLFTIASLAMVVQGLLAPTGRMRDLPAFVNAFQVSIGLLLVSAAATTSLAEECARGGLDVILATPLATRAIVLGKWWASFRMVPFLAFWPCVLVLSEPTGGMRLIGVVQMFVSILGYGALTTSIGLACAAWIPRLGRSLAASILIYLGITVGTVCLAFGMGDLFANQSGGSGLLKWVFAALFVATGALCFGLLNRLGRTTAAPIALAFAACAFLFILAIVEPKPGGRPAETFAGGIIVESSWFGPGLLTAILPLRSGVDVGSTLRLYRLWTIVNFVASFVIMNAVLATFDHCLGRVKDRSRARFFDDEQLEELRTRAGSVHGFLRSRFFGKLAGERRSALIGEPSERSSGLPLEL